MTYAASKELRPLNEKGGNGTVTIYYNFQGNEVGLSRVSNDELYHYDRRQSVSSDLTSNFRAV